MLSAAAELVAYGSGSVAPIVRLRHGRTPSISTSSEKTSNVRTSTITPRTPTLVSVGDTATVRMRSCGDKNLKADKEPASEDPAASPIDDARGLATQEIASHGHHGEQEREDQQRDGDPLECPRDVLHRAHPSQCGVCVGSLDVG